MVTILHPHAWAAVVVPAMLACGVVAVAWQEPANGALARGARTFASACASCHGHGAAGGDKGPSLVGNRRLRAMSHADVEAVIRRGTPNGMPPFALAAGVLDDLTGYVRSLNASAFDMQPAGDIAAGERFFFGSGACATCHMVGGRGASFGPDLSAIGRQLTLAELSTALTTPDATIAPGFTMVRVRRDDGSIVEGFARNEGNQTLPVQTVEGRLYSLEKGTYTRLPAERTSLMPALKATADEERDLVAYLSRLDGRVTVAATPPAMDPRAFDRILRPTPGDWPTYHGTLDGNRYSALDEINAKNVGTLALQWIYSMRDFNLEVTPLVMDGTMYVTGPNQLSALDARSGRELWRFSRPRTPGVQGDAGSGLNRGAALLGDRVFFVTDDARLLCLNRLTGALMWEALLPEDRTMAYGGTAAPLVVGDLVIAGVSGGDHGIRGFLAAYHVATGRQAWRFWTVPAPGEPGSETWKGGAIALGGGATWLTGSYDPETATLFWPTGNPYPDTDGSERGGDNLYTNSVVALDVKTGTLKWHFQFTPHDLHDWDAQSPLVLVDTRFEGRDRKLLVQANRNGFYYVLDRTDGTFLLGVPFVKKLTWASGIGADGRPQLLPNNAVSEQGTLTCPAIRGATNWMATSFHPGTGLFYVMAVENCGIYRSSMFGTGLGAAAAARGQRGTPPPRAAASPPRARGRGASAAEPAGRVTLGGNLNEGPNSGGTQVLRALEIDTGKVVWEIPQVGSSNNYAGTLATAGGLVFYAQASGELAAVDARTGAHLWHFEGQEPWKASPMTYTVDGRQYVAIAALNNILSFALPEDSPRGRVR